MSEPGGAPWSDGAGRTGAGGPPPGWWKADDGRWYPPASGESPRAGAPTHRSNESYWATAHDILRAGGRRGGTTASPSDGDWAARVTGPGAQATYGSTGPPTSSPDDGRHQVTGTAGPTAAARGDGRHGTTGSAGHWAAGYGRARATGGDGNGVGPLPGPGREGRPGPVRRPGVVAPTNDLVLNGLDPLGPSRAGRFTSPEPARPNGAEAPEEVVDLGVTASWMSADDAGATTARAPRVGPYSVPALGPSRRRAYADEPVRVSREIRWGTSGEHPTPSGERRVTRQRMSGPIATYRSWPLWARVVAPATALALVVALSGSLGGSERPAQEAVGTANTSPPTTGATEAPAPLPTPSTTVPPSSLPIVTAPPPTAPVVSPGSPAGEPTAGQRRYDSCDAARAAGAAPVFRGDPAYGSHLDDDGDGIGCES